MKLPSFSAVVVSFVCLLATGPSIPAARAADAEPPDEMDQMMQTLDGMKASMQTTKARMQDIVTGLTDSRAYLQSLAVSPADLVGKDLKSAVGKAQTLTFDQWSAALAGNKDAIVSALSSDSVMRENIAKISLQEKGIEDQLHQIRAQGEEISRQFSELADKGKNIKKTFGNALKLGSMFFKLKSVGSELKGFDTLLVSAGTESGAFLKQTATLFALVPAAAPTPELLAEVAAKNPPPAPIATQPAVSGSSPAAAAAPAVASFSASAPLAPAASLVHGVLAGLWSGEITHLASGTKIKVQLCVGTPHPGKIVGYLLIPVRDEQNPLYLEEVRDGKYILAEGVDAAPGSRQVLLAGTDANLTGLGIEIMSSDGASEMQGALTRL